MHRRPEVDAAATVHLQNPKLDDSVFDYYNTTPSVDTSAIQETLTWPSFTAQGSQSIPVGQALLADCHKRDDFEAASGCWKADFLPSGTFVENLDTGRVLLLCGVVGCMAHVAWDVEVVTKAKGEVFYRPKTDDSAAWRFEFLYRWESVEVWPTEVICPARQYCHQGFRLDKDLGIVARRTGQRRSILEHGARDAFWQLPLTLLKKAIDDLGLVPQDGGVFSAVEALLLRAMPNASQELIDEIMLLRGTPPAKVLPDSLKEGLLDALDDQDAERDMKAVQSQSATFTYVLRRVPHCGILFHSRACVCRSIPIDCTRIRHI